MENPRAQCAKARGDRQCHRKQTARGFSKERPRVRVKRRGKSPPPAQQCAGHEKPSAVQDITGGPASGRPAHEPATVRQRQPPGNSRTGGAGSGSRRRLARLRARLREMIVTRRFPRRFRRQAAGTESGLPPAQTGRLGETLGRPHFFRCRVRNPPAWRSRAAPFVLPAPVPTEPDQATALRRRRAMPTPRQSRPTASVAGSGTGAASGTVQRMASVCAPVVSA